MQSPIIITITGPGASGKSTLCGQVVEKNPQLFQTIGIDHYWLDHSTLNEDELRAHNLDQPSAYDIPLLTKHIHEFLNQTPFKPPEICFSRRSTTTSSQTITPDKILLLEGTMAGAIPACVEHSKLVVFIDAPLDICLCRRLLRKRSRRHDTIEPTIQKYLTHIRPGYLKYIASIKETADLILTGMDHETDYETLLTQIEQLQ